MTRRWLLLPLLAMFVAPLAWSAAAATFVVSPSVLQTVVLDDVPDLEPGTATITVRALEFNNGGQRPGNPQDVVRTLTLEVGATYRVGWSEPARQRACPADLASSPGGYGDFPVQGDFEHIVCYRSGGQPNQPGELVFLEASAAPTGTTSSTTASVLQPSSNDEAATSGPTAQLERSEPSTGEAEEPLTVESRPGEPVEDAFDLPADEQDQAHQRDGEAAP